MESANESNPPQLPSMSLFKLLPEDIVLSILARMPTSYYPTLCLVSKTFRSLIISEELGTMRSYLGTREEGVNVCIQSRINPRDCRWFSLWTNPKDCKPLFYWTRRDKCTGNFLLPLPSSYYPRLPICYETVGSETYEIGGQNKPSSTDVWVYNKLIGKRRKAPSMSVARENPFTCSLDGKLYVMGGCEGDESTYWAEVFDPKTQTWEPLPDPGVEIRFSLIKMVETEPGKVLLRSNNKFFVYLVKECRWEVYHANCGESICKIDGVWYAYNQRECWWYDTKREKWRLVRGLTELCQEFSCEVEIGSYGGKLVIFWVGPAVYPFLSTSRIWCAVILLKTGYSRYGEVWGQVEWADLVLTAPWSHSVRLCCVESVQ
ncbi:unnamed protein product [Eruca vesicaria subsp. sativa]|uniref:F-box domain-containing protein n=1 Tax=Eruca vesicaria subsp. sativa TaxID=29727 RepID=A0ABC8JZM3_ERUVS|nr:unnamed protein product [Eruca vesicaria subsp. sativa]